MQVSFSFWSCVLLKTWWSIVDTLEGFQLEVIPGCFFRCCWAATRNLCWLVLTGGPHFNYELTTCSDCSPEVISDVSCLAGWQEAFFFWYIAGSLEICLRISCSCPGHFWLTLGHDWLQAWCALISIRCAAWDDKSDDPKSSPKWQHTEVWGMGVLGRRRGSVIPKALVSWWRNHADGWKDERWWNHVIWYGTWWNY